MSLLAFFYSASPWLIGSALGYLVVERYQRNEGLALLCAGAGGFYGYLAIALIILICEKFGILVLKEPFTHFVSSAAAIATILVGVIVIPKFKHTFSADRISASLIVLVGATISLVSVNAFHSTLLPVHGWDTLDLWAPQALEIIAFQQDPDLVFENRSYHPATLSRIMSWSAVASSSFHQPTSQWPWFLMWLSVWLVTYGFSRAQGASGLMSAIVAYVALSIPLLENHSLIIGYGGLPVAVGLMSSCAFFALAQKTSSHFFIIIGVVCALSVVPLKNTGPFYMLVAIAGWIFSMAHNRSFFNALILFVSCIFLLWIFSWVGFSFRLFTHTFSYDPATNTILFGGKLLQIINTPVAQIFSNQFTSWFIHSSFGILFVAYFILMFFRFFSGSTFQPSLALVSYCFLFGIVGLMASQFTEYGLNHSLPGSDTGLSRFTMPIACLIPLAMSALAREFFTDNCRYMAAEHSG